MYGKRLVAEECEEEEIEETWDSVEDDETEKLCFNK